MVWVGMSMKNRSKKMSLGRRASYLNSSKNYSSLRGQIYNRFLVVKIFFEKKRNFFRSEYTNRNMAMQSY